MRFLTALWIVACVAFGGTLSAEEPMRPHVVIVYVDDMGLGDLGCYGGTLAPTPRIDRWGAEGTRFTQYYSASPICSPSRAGLLTGRFPAHARITSYLQTKAGNRGCGQADFLDPEIPVLPRLLKSTGYATAHFGKWHLGGGRDVDDAPPFSAYGYDEHAGTWESPEPHPDITATDWIWSDKDAVKRWDRTAFFVDRTLDFLERHPEQPCFVNLWLDDVHTPWVPHADRQGKDTPENLRQVLIELDEQMGRLLDGIEQQGLTQRTLLLFASDNGPLPTFQGKRAAGLRGSKLSLYEGGIRLPLLVRWPGRVPAGRVDEDSVLSAVDLFPTLCGLAGATLPDGCRPDGEDVRDIWFGTSRQRKADLLWEYGRNAEFFAYPKIERDRSPPLAIRRGPWKLLTDADGATTELYDLAADRFERHNLAADHPEVVRSLKDRLHGWRESWPSE